MNVTDVQEKLKKEHETLGNWRSVAEQYGVNVAYVYNLAMKGKVPGNRDIRVRLGLEQRPKSKSKGPVEQMIAETRRALSWKVKA